MIGYIARDNDGSLFLYDEEPKYDSKNKMWLGANYNYMQITEQSILDKFAELSYHDTPVPVEIKFEILK